LHESPFAFHRAIGRADLLKMQQHIFGRYFFNPNQLAAEHAFAFKKELNSEKSLGSLKKNQDVTVEFIF
jgi:hypothetical protein